MNISNRVTQRSSVWPILIAVLVVPLIAACGAKKDKIQSQTAARVNKEEITVHQINFVLQQQRGLRAEQSDAASKQILERLIDQQLAVGRAEEMKLDRDPRVLQQLEAAKREIVARAYFDRIGEGATKPTPEDVKKYYQDTPALFSQRRIYQLQEINVEATPEQVDSLRAKLNGVKNIGEFIEHLKAGDIKFVGNQMARAAEQLPLQSLPALSAMKEGQALFNPTPSGAQIVFLVGARSQPVTEDQARPAIEQFLLNDRRRKLIEEDLKTLRAGAKVEYVGKFAEAAASAASAAAPAPAASPPQAAPAKDPMAQGLSGLK